VFFLITFASQKPKQAALQQFANKFAIALDLHYFCFTKAKAGGASTICK